MNRFQYDNIQPTPTPARRKSVLEQKCGINRDMSKYRRVAKQARNKANKAVRASQ